MNTIDQFRFKSIEKEDLVLSYDTLDEKKKADYIAAIWEIDLALEKMIEAHVGKDNEPTDEMKKWMPFKGISPYNEWKKLINAGKEIIIGELLRLADEVEDKQITIKGLNTNIFGEDE
jgi:hypothetical protein|tara:strand:+ start:139 stop:492 length:354 start_codon:yes stop_codon:yes gene_type:complete